jgi:hypothetical protein
MKKFKSAVLSILIVASTLVLSLSQAQATPILITDNNQLLGANGINIDGSFFDVRFVDGTCADVFGGICSRNNFTFQSQADGFTAAAALLNQIFDTIAGRPFDIDPELIFGCESVIACQILIPINIFSGQLLTSAVAGNSNGVGVLSSGSTTIVRTTDNLLSSSTQVFASFVRSASVPSASVPEPSAAILLLCSFGILMTQRLRHRLR